MRQRLVRRCACAGVVVLAAGLGWSHPAAAAGTNDLGAIGFGTVVIDSADQHVIVSGVTTNSVYVLDYRGRLVTTIANVYGAYGMVIDNGTLYVAESTAGTIARIELKTLARDTDLGSGLVHPTWLVQTGGTLWTTSGNDYQSQQLAEIDPSSGAVTVYTQRSFYAPDLAASPGDAHTLFVAEDGLSPGAIYRLDVSGDQLVTVAQNTFTDQENIEQLAVSADGSRVIPASGYPYEFEELSASTLQPDGIIYPGKPYPSAVAVSGKSAMRLATGLDNGYSSPDVEVDPLGTPAPIFTASTNTEAGVANVPPHGLALNNAGTKLAVVTSAGASSDVVVHVYSVTG